MAVRIVTDSASSIDDVELERLAIQTVSLHVTDGSRDMSEAELRSSRFYERLEDMETLPHTSQPAPEEFATVFRRLVAQGQEVLAILISAGMSGTVESARTARAALLAESPDVRVEVLDSRSNSLEEGFAVLSAAETARHGGSLESCQAAAMETMRRTRFLFTPHSLEYLRKGGRISGASALASMALRIAPVLTAERGRTGVAGVARSGRSASAKIATLMRRDVAAAGLRRAAVQYIADEEKARRFAAEVIEPIAGKPVPIVPIPAVVGLHVGPAVGVVYETAEPLR